MIIQKDGHCFLLYALLESKRRQAYLMANAAVYPVEKPTIFGRTLYYQYTKKCNLNKSQGEGCLPLITRHGSPSSGAWSPQEQRKHAVTC
jgi:hypothetical protein